jgi:hypothetical protein
MTKRTSPDDVQSWDDAQDIDRATPAKGRRRNRRYENRLLKSQLDSAELDED